MNDIFIYDGVPSLEFGAYIYRDDSEFKTPERSYEKISVPGKNGDLIFDNGRFENVTMVYSVVIPKNAKTNLQGFMQFIHEKTGYRRLEDSIHEDEFYTAMVEGEIEPTVSIDGESAKFKLKFTRYPQRWLKIGEEKTEYTGSGQNIIVNPTGMTAKPLVRVYGYGQFIFGNHLHIIKEHTRPYIDLDSEIEDAYYGSINMNEFVQMASSFYDTAFPILIPGQNIVMLNTPSTLTKLVLTPRWWRI